MTETERRLAARQFSVDWQGRGDEKQETQTFWLALLQKVYGIAEPDKYINFEKTVNVDNTKTGKSNTKFIDGYIGATRVLIEQKGTKIDLNKGETQSDGSMLSPYQQARRYGGYLPANQQPRWIVVCNFKEFRIHDMNRPNDAPEILLLSDLEKEYTRLNFLVDTGDANIRKEMEISLQAGELVGVLYDALLKQYAEPESEETLKSLNALCVRLVFCLYAEDSGIFGKHNMFHDYLQAHRAEDRRALINLFRVLDQKEGERDRYLDDDLAAFPYVNGGLFANENIEIPRLGDEIIDLLLSRASEDFDWSAISPTIFGAVFESTLNPQTRRTGGMHYTSIENIHKVIDPLFLPMSFLTPDIISSNQLYIVGNAGLYHFGVLTSNVHMAWMRAVCGRLEMRYRYSSAVVYNNFPWPMPTDEQKAKIEQTAQAILDARALYPDCSLADLYDEVTMPPELRKAHQANDKAVMQAYGFWGKLNTETACVAELMKMYQQLVEENN